MNEARHQVFRVVVTVAIVGGLFGVSLWMLRPFVPSLLWATTIAVATWPLMLGVQRLLRRRWLAVTVMSLALLLVFAIPLAMIINTIIVHVDDITGWAKSIETLALGEPPAWLSKVPLAGDRLVAAWQDLAADGDLGAKLAPYMGSLVSWFVAQLGSLGEVAGQLLITVIITAILYAQGETAGRAVLAFMRRVSDEHGEDSVRLAGQAIRGVALGVVVTAAVQALLGAIGLLVVGVPFVFPLSVLMLMLALMQIGVVPVLAGAVIWKYSQGHGGWATALLVWTVAVASIDNVLRPILIRKGADLPLLLIFVGVVGGLIAFGMVGIFIGPVVLAVTWKLLAAWVRADPAAPAPPAPDATPTAAT